MKRLLTIMVTALAAVSLASCGKKDAPTPAGPTIALEGLDITQVHEITGEPMTVKVNVKADAGIKTSPYASPRRCSPRSFFRVSASRPRWS